MASNHMTLSLRIRKRLLLFIISIILGSSVWGVLTVVFFFRARRRRRQRIGISAMSGIPRSPSTESITAAVQQEAENNLPFIQMDDSNYNKLKTLIDSIEYQSITSISGNILLSKYGEMYKDMWEQLANNTKLFIITQCETDDEEEQYREKLCNFLQDTKYLQYRLLFCSTTAGRGHISRHVGSNLHIDDCKETLNQLKPFISNLVYTPSN